MSSSLPVNPGHFKSLHYASQHAGVKLIVTGAVHGNETCGTKAIHRVMDELDSGALTLKAGSVSFVPTANALAYAKGQRMGDRNLNRNLGPTKTPRDYEDHVANWLCPLLAQHEVLLDLHSFRAGTEAFAMVGPLNSTDPLQPFQHAHQEETMVRHLGVRRFVDGWLSTYATGVARRIAAARAAGRSTDSLDTDPRYGIGTTEYMRALGGYSITLECGQHDDPKAPEVAYRAILNTMALLGLIDGSPVPVAAADIEALSLYEVIDKNHPDDQFARPWISFDALVQGDHIGTRADGTKVFAEQDGFIVFPDAGARAGHEWFYLAKKNHRFD